MDLIPELFIAAILLCYSLKIIIYGLHWKKYPTHKNTHSLNDIAISVVIAFRNEEGKLGSLLQSLAGQNYPKELYEVILVNDGSEDGSVDIVRGFCKDHHHFRLIDNHIRQTGKKQALMEGIRNAGYEFILTTDADCTFNDQWLHTFASFIAGSHPDMVIGLVIPEEENGFLQRFRELEFASLIAAGAGAAAAGRPIYCNGACMAYKRDLLLNASHLMIPQTVSGDDTFLLHALKKMHKRIVLLKSQKATVSTKQPETWKEFADQRKRWASKSPFYRDFDTVSTGIMIVLMNLAIIASAIVFFAGFNYWLFPLVYGIKLLADMFLLKSFYKFFKRTFPMVNFLLAELMYPFFLLFILYAGMFSEYEWKGRKYGSRGRVLSN